MNFFFLILEIKALVSTGKRSLVDLAGISA